MAGPVPPEDGAAPPWGSAPPMVLANWTQRALAYLLDVTILLVLLALSEPILAAVLGEAPLLLAGYAAGVTFLYFLGFTLAGGRTPGKRAFRLRTAALDGAAPTGGQSLLEALSKTVVPFLVVDLLAGLASGRARRQRLVQRAGGLVVLFDAPQAPRRVVFVP